jgi:hypothetical protein
MLEISLYIGKMYIKSMKNGIMFEKIKEKSSFTYLSVLVGTNVKAIEALLELAFVRSI